MRWVNKMGAVGKPVLLLNEIKVKVRTIIKARAVFNKLSKGLIVPLNTTELGLMEKFFKV